MVRIHRQHERGVSILHSYYTPIIVPHFLTLKHNRYSNQLRFHWSRMSVSYRAHSSRVQQHYIIMNQDLRWFANPPVHCTSARCRPLPRDHSTMHRSGRYLHSTTQNHEQPQHQRYMHLIVRLSGNLIDMSREFWRNNAAHTYRDRGRYLQRSAYPPAHCVGATSPRWIHNHFPTLASMGSCQTVSHQKIA